MIRVVVAGGMMLAVGAACGQVIDFETLPDGSIPSDDLPLGLSSFYSVEGVEVRFGWDTDSDGDRNQPALFEQAGGGPPGAEISGFFHCADDFTGGQVLADTADPRFADQLGEFMLRRPQPFDESWRFIVEYSEPVQAASGQIWDIERGANNEYERWLVEAYLGNDLVGSISSPDGTDLSIGPCGGFDGEPWVFSFVGSGLFDSIAISYLGTQSDAGFVFDQFLATTSLPGPTLLTHQPDHAENDPAGVPQARLYWSEPVTISATDITVLTADATGQPVPFVVEGSGTQVTTITFTGQPSGADTGSPVPLQLGGYAITVRDTARASANNAPIDGDNDGVAGGDVTVTVTHVCISDLAEPAGLLDLSDVNVFVDGFVNGCE